MADINEEISHLGLDGLVQVCPLPARVVNTTGVDHVEDVFATLQERINQPRPFITALLGHFGSGKSSTCLRLAQKMLATSLASHTRFPLPVLLQATDIQSVYGQSILCVVADAVEHQYSSKLSRQLVEHLIETRKLVVVIDALDESAILSKEVNIFDMLRHLPGKNKGQYILTARRELFSARELEEFALSGADVEQFQIAPIETDVARSALEGTIEGNGIAALFSDEALEIGFVELIRTPLFLSYASAISSTQLQKIITDRNSVHEVAYDIFSEFVAKWARREEDREISQRFDAGFDFRFEFCRKLAVFSRDTTVGGEITLDMLRSALQEHFEETGVGAGDIERKLVAARLSMLLVRKDVLDDEDECFKFSHRALQSYFLAKEIELELASALKDGHLLRDHLRPYQDSLAVAYFNDARDVLVPTFLYGNRKRSGIQQLLSSALSDIRDGGTTMRQLAVEDYRIVPNLLYLRYGIQRASGGDIDGELTSLCAPLIGFRQFEARMSAAVVGKSRRIVLRPNMASLEFAVLPNDLRIPDGNFELDESGVFLGPVLGDESDAASHDPADRLDIVREFCSRAGIVRDDPRDAVSSLADCDVPDLRWVVTRPRTITLRLDTSYPRALGISRISSTRPKWSFMSAE